MNDQEIQITPWKDQTTEGMHGNTCRIELFERVPMIKE